MASLPRSHQELLKRGRKAFNNKSMCHRAPHLANNFQCRHAITSETYIKCETCRILNIVQPKVVCQPRIKRRQPQIVRNKDGSRSARTWRLYGVAQEQCWTQGQRLKPANAHITLLSLLSQARVTRWITDVLVGTWSNWKEVIPLHSLSGCSQICTKETTLTAMFPSPADTQRARDSPREDDHKVHYIPAIAEVGAFVKCEAQGDDLNGGLKTEYSNKVGLCVVLQKDRENQRGEETSRRISFCWR